MKIGFIGVGVMGKSMVRNLMKRGHEVSVYSRTKEKALDVIQEGAHWCDGIGSCVAEKDAVITIVGFPRDVEEVYFGKEGILANIRPGTYLIDMTTTSPKLAVKIYNEAIKKNACALDAPVSGGDVGARNGTLSIMVGGDRDVFEAMQPVLACMGTSILYEGRAGSGQHTKMANQIAISGAIAGVCEALAYAKKVGLDVDKMFQSISQGAAASFQMNAAIPRIEKGDFAPGFFVKHFVKDMKIADEEARDASLELRILQNVLQMYQALEEKGLGDLGTQALIKYYE
ncbi:MAG: NAD(P)-dependent oxidoreductase [Christensenellales bacterium]